MAAAVLAAALSGEGGEFGAALDGGDALPAVAYGSGDLGLALRPVGVAGGGECLALESREFFLPPAVAASAAAAAAEMGVAARPVLTYLAIGLAAHGREVPYSMVSALGPAPRAGPEAGQPRLVDGAAAPALAGDDILLDSWAAEDLAAQYRARMIGRVHPSRQHESRRLAHDDHFIASLAVFSNDENERYLEILLAQFFGDLENMFGALRTQFCLRTCD